MAWWGRALESIADRGRELLNLRDTPKEPEELVEMCRALLGGAGEASGTALAREVVRGYDGLAPDLQDTFIDQLAEHFSAPREGILDASERYRDAPPGEDFDALLALANAVESPRQELFRRINRADRGTATLVAMRTRVLRRLRQAPALSAVDADLKHLLSSWFNPGFLRLEQIDWDSPASVLEKLISYETVHEIRDWDDLRRRLEADRRCYAFFHPALPGEPLIFVEVALVKGLSDSAARLLDQDAPVIDPATADTAIFYSINNCQYGLRGISFGNFLIKRVMGDLIAQLPQVEKYATFSPMPRFAQTLRGDGEHAFDPEILDALTADWASDLCTAAGIERSGEALLRLLEAPLQHRDILAAPLHRIALAYLTRVHRNGRPLDPVACFHLSNGAQIEKITPFADTSETRIQASFGTMVNYRYEASDVERNHEQFVSEGHVVLSKALHKEDRRLQTLWGTGG